MLRRIALVGGSVALAGLIVALGVSPSGAATGHHRDYALAGTEPIPELGICVTWALSGSLHYEATELGRLPVVVSHRISTVSLTAPTVAVAALTYDAKTGACTTRPARWSSLSVLQVWTGKGYAGGLERTTYGPSATAEQFNSGVTPEFGSAFYSNLTRGRPPCYRVAVDLRLTVGAVDTARRTAPRAVCLTPGPSGE